MIVVHPLRKTSRLVQDQDAKIGVFDLIDQVLAAFVVVVQMPGFMVSVPITEDEKVINRTVEDGTDVRLEAPWAGGGWRLIDVKDGERRFTDCGDGLRRCRCGRCLTYRWARRRSTDARGWRSRLHPL